MKRYKSCVAKVPLTLLHLTRYEYLKLRLCNYEYFVLIIRRTYMQCLWE